MLGAGLVLALLADPQLSLHSTSSSPCTLDNVDGVVESSCAIRALSEVEGSLSSSCAPQAAVDALEATLAANISRLEAKLDRLLDVYSPRMVVSLEVSNQADYNAWIASQSLTDSFAECYDSWPKWLALTYSGGHTTLSSYLAWRGYDCTLSQANFALLTASARLLGDKRGNALWIDHPNLRCEYESYVEGYYEVTIPASMCSG